MSEDTEYVPVCLVAYEDDADLDVDYGDEPTVENHDELVNSGQTFTEIRLLSRSDAEQYNMHIIEPGDPLWSDEVAELDQGESIMVEA